MAAIGKGGANSANLKLQKVVQGGGCEMTPEQFEKLIQERKAERKRKAEEKRLEGLRRIAEMKSAEGIHPLAQFPKEIWLMILENVTPVDRRNLYHLHPLFSDLMEENRIRDILLPLALDRKIPFVESLVRNDRGQLNLKRLLELRLVSKAARESIDNWIEDDLLISMRNSWFSPRFEPIQIDDMAILNRMLEFLSKGPKRFPRRALQIQISPWCTSNMSTPSFPQVVLPEFEEDEDDNDETEEEEENDDEEEDQEVQDVGWRFRRDFAKFHENLKTLLKKIGDDILYFQLDLMSLDELDELGISFRRIYNALGEYVTLMPNMKWLDVRIAWFDTASLILKPNGMADARAITQNDPFPKIDGLERVHFWGWEEYPLWDAILTANPHLKYHTHREKNASGEYQLVRFADPSVLSLSLETLDAQKDCPPWDMPLLQQVSDSSNWKLRKLTLEMRGQYHAPPINMGDVLRALQKFPALEDVYLAINNVYIGNDIDFLMLPNLKKLEIMLRPRMSWTKGFQFFFSLQFLLKCGKLTSISWNALLNYTRMIQREMDKLDVSNAQLDFKGGWGDLSASNIWNVFPYLKCVHVNLWGMIGGQCKPYIRKYGNRKLEYEENPGLRVD